MAVRWNASHKLYLDDAWATSAFIILLALCIVITLAVPPMENILKVAAGIEEPSANFDSNGTYFLKLQFAYSILFWTCLWCVKGRFCTVIQFRTLMLIYARLLPVFLLPLDGQIEMVSLGLVGHRRVHSVVLHRERDYPARRLFLIQPRRLFKLDGCRTIMGQPEV